MKKGFTLIELLAVLIIMSVIAIVTVPILGGVIADYKKNAFKNTAYGMIAAAEDKQAEFGMETDGYETEIFDLTGNDLTYKGARPKAGSLLIDENGLVALEMNNGNYCVTKAKEDKDVKVTRLTPENPCDGSGLPTIEKYSVNYIVLETLKTTEKGNYTLYTLPEEWGQPTCYEIEGTEYEACYIVETDDTMYKKGKKVTLKEFSLVHRLTSSNELIEKKIYYNNSRSSSYWDYELDYDTAKVTDSYQGWKYWLEYDMALNPSSTSTESAILNFDTVLHDALETDGYIALSSPNTFTMPAHDVFFLVTLEPIHSIVPSPPVDEGLE